MKKIMALFLSLTLLLAFCGCSVRIMKEEESANTETEEDLPVRPGDDGVLMLALISGPEGIADGDLNQAAYEVCKQYASGKNVFFSYYVLPGSSTANRIDLIEGAIADGYEVLVLPGSGFAETITQTVKKYPDVKFVALDVSASDLGDAFEIPENLFCADYSEEICGFMAGYAAVKMGYRHLGFLGSKVSATTQHYGNGFLQGAEAAALSDGLTDVRVEFIFSGNEKSDNLIVSTMAGWYKDLGVEVVFAAGGRMYEAAARGAYDAEMAVAPEEGETATDRNFPKVIGSAFDRSSELNSIGRGISLTSAEKGVALSMKWILSELVLPQNWAEYGGQIKCFGLESGDEPRKNGAQLSYFNTAWNDSFTRDDYGLLVQQLYTGELSVTQTIGEQLQAVSVNYFDNIE